MTLSTAMLARFHAANSPGLTLIGAGGGASGDYAVAQVPAGPSPQAAMEIYQHATLDREQALAEKIGEAYAGWQASRGAE